MSGQPSDLDTALFNLHKALHDPAFDNVLFKPELHDVYNITQYSYMCIWMFFGLHLMAKAAEYLIAKYSVTYHDLVFNKQRIIMTYVAEIAVTTVILIIQIYYAYELFWEEADDGSIDHRDFGMLTFAISLIPVLYVWELIYRPVIGTPLFVHHMIAIILGQFVAATVQDTRDPRYIRFTFLLSLHASTEQVSFVALMMYRFKRRSAAGFFRFAAIWSACIKTIVIVFAFYLWVNFLTGDAPENSRWHMFWKVSFGPLNIILYFTQMYACYILFLLSARAKKLPPRKKRAKKSSSKDSSLEMESPDDSSKMTTKVSTQSSFTGPSSITMKLGDHQPNKSDSDDDDEPRIHVLTRVPTIKIKSGSFKDLEQADERTFDQNVSSFY